MAQWDDEAFDFKRNSLRVGFGNQNGTTFPVRYIGARYPQGSADVEVEYERLLNKLFSASILYKFVDYDLSVYKYREHQRQVNIFYTPFGTYRRIQFKLGAGVTHSTIHQTSDFPVLLARTPGGFDWGVIGIAELNYTIVRNISVGIKGYKQMTYWNNTPFGGLVKMGYSF